MSAPLADPLAGIRVVEVAHFIAAPAGGSLLADLGAEVIKVEIPGGELYRHVRPTFLGVESDFPASPGFQMDNRGKRSLTLDLRRGAARTALQRIIDTADVLLTNVLPARRAKYGLDAEALLARKPELIYASLTGYGMGGEQASLPSFDYTAYWARTGLMDLMHDEGTPPNFLRPGVGDHAAAISLVAGILAALRVREQSGRGQVVDVSLLGVGLYVAGCDLATATAAGVAPSRHRRSAPLNPLWNHYPTADGRWLFLVMVETDRYWPPLCRAIARPELEADPRFASAEERTRHASALVEILDGVFRGHTLAEWERRLQGQPIIWAPVRTMDEAVRDPQVAAMGYLPVLGHPLAGSFRTVAPPFRLSESEARPRGPAPELGADAEAVLTGAGLSRSEIEATLRSD